MWKSHVSERMGLLDRRDTTVIQKTDVKQWLRCVALFDWGYQMPNELPPFTIFPIPNSPTILKFLTPKKTGNALVFRVSMGGTACLPWYDPTAVTGLYYRKCSQSIFYLLFNFTSNNSLIFTKTYKPILVSSWPQLQNVGMIIIIYIELVFVCPLLTSVLNVLRFVVTR